jgi:predicted trehalose synthase
MDRGGIQHLAGPLDAAMAIADGNDTLSRGGIPQEDLQRFESWVRFWNRGINLVFLKSYLHRLDQSGLLPRNEPELRAMLHAYLLNQMIGELGCELSARTDRLGVTLQGILHLAAESPPGGPTG